MPGIFRAVHLLSSRTRAVLTDEKLVTDLKIPTKRTAILYARCFGIQNSLSLFGYTTITKEIRFTDIINCIRFLGRPAWVHNKHNNIVLLC